MKQRLHICQIIISVLLLFKGEVFAQNQKQIDSLKQIITLAKQDTNKVITLLELGDQYEHNKPNSALVYYHRALDIYNKIAADGGGKCLSKEYVNTQNKLKFECEKEHQ